MDVTVDQCAALDVHEETGRRRGIRSVSSAFLGLWFGMTDEPTPISWVSLFKVSLRRQYPNSFAQKTLTITLLLLVLILAVVFYSPASRGEMALGTGLAAISILTFTVFFQSDGNTEDRTEALRRAIAASTVLTFLVLLGLLVFAEPLQDSASRSNLVGDLVNDFRWVVIAVVGFYFANDIARRFIDAKYPTSDSGNSVDGNAVGQPE